MKGAKSFMKNNDQIAFISFKVNEPRHLKLVDSKEDKIKDKRSGEMVDGVKFLVEEHGEKKTFFTSSFKLIGLLSDFEEGSEVTVMQVKYNDGGTFKTSYEVAAGFITPSRAKNGSNSQQDSDGSDVEEQSLEDTANQQANW